jgi:hypothetical protein
MCPRRKSLPVRSSPSVQRTISGADLAERIVNHDWGIKTDVISPKNVELMCEATSRLMGAKRLPKIIAAQTWQRDDQSRPEEN